MTGEQIASSIRKLGGASTLEEASEILPTLDGVDTLYQSFNCVYLSIRKSVSSADWKKEEYQIEAYPEPFH